MDKLKYIKLENEDGSYSDSIPLAVDSDHVDVGGNTLTDELANKASVEDVNNSIDNLSNQISGLASGSPKGTYKTAEELKNANPETGVYIAIGDGHIYSWTKNQDGDPIDLGVYQAVEIGDKSVTPEKTNFIIAQYEDFEPVNVYLKDEIVKGEWCNTETGKFEITEYTGNYAHTNFIETKEDIRYIRKFNFDTGSSVVFFDKDKNYLSSVTNSASETESSGIRGFEFTTPKLSKFMVLNTVVSYSENDYCYQIDSLSPILAKVSIPLLDINDKSIDPQKTNFAEAIYKNFEPIDILKDVSVKEKYYCDVTTGDIVTTEYTQNYKCTDFIAINPNDKYLSAGNFDIGYSVVYFDSSKKFISGQDNHSSNESVGEITGYPLDIPQNAKYLIANGQIVSDADYFKIFKVTSQEKEIDKLLIPKLDISDKINPLLAKKANNLLQGKRIVCFGDSITEFGTYPEQIGDLLGIEAINVGFGGTRLVEHDYVGDYNAFCFCNIVKSIVSKDWSSQELVVDSIGGKFPEILNKLKAIDFNEIDIITFLYGTNDFTSGYVSLGEKKSQNNKEINGALNYCLSTLMTNYPKLKIYALTPIFRKTIPNTEGTSDDNPSGAEGNTLWLYEIADAICEKANEYHIPSKNLYNTSNINKFNYNSYLTSDGVHPNDEGFSLLADKIAKFINSN